MPTMNQRTFTIDDERSLTIAARGVVGHFGLMMGLGLGRMPVAHQGDALARAEWVDILAKIRGMGFAETLYRFPIARHYCGCSLFAVPAPIVLDAPEWPAGDEPPNVLGRLVVTLCPSHPYADLDGTIYKHVALAWIVDRQPESHGARRS